jgi:hypothetical protein
MKRLGIAGLLLSVSVLLSQALAYPTLNSFLTLWLLPGGGNLNDAYSGALITNLGATGAQTLNLPRAISGLHITVSLAVAQDVNINPDNFDQILVLTNEAGDEITSNATIGDTVELVAIDDSKWLPIRTVGTWSNANP